MVTKLERASRHASESTLDKSEKDLKEMTAKTKDKVDAAIKARTESTTILYSAAAYAMYLGIVHARWEQFNRLFKNLPPIDSDALRQKFAFRVNDKYAVDGVRVLDADGNPTDKWAVRPTTMISYLANPADKQSHFSLAKAPEGEKGEAKRKLISAYRDKVAAAGVEDLESIQWTTREAVERAPAPYDADRFKKDVARLIKNAAQGLSDPELGVSRSTLESFMREANLPKAVRISLRAEMDKQEGYKDSQNDNRSRGESNESNGKPDSAEEKTQAAA